MCDLPPCTVDSDNVTVSVSPVSVVLSHGYVLASFFDTIVYQSDVLLLTVNGTMGYDVISFASQWWRAFLAEVVSTALLLWLGCATLVPVGGPGSVMLTHPALGFGFIYLANICAFGSVSGAHMNPAVTLGAVLYGQLEPIPAVGYVLAQLVGATLGFSGMLATTPGDDMDNVGLTLPAEGLAPGNAMVTELVMTSMLVLTVCGVWASPETTVTDVAAPIKIGLIVAGLVYAGSPATGASFNPARSFAPALIQGRWEHHWVYWVGPLLGAGLAAVLHRWVLTLPGSAAVAPASAHVAAPGVVIRS
ncbi:aquaporin AQPAe.a-like [Anticarsia gemmatalis]|uniref:aquaporin AQPAe.a-like n=1 Tax=Anticarsia gemmatalis TaxID=129554 RepID=UPI003F76816F